MGSNGKGVGQFGQNVQKLHKNDKIGIFGAKQWGRRGLQANFLGSVGIPPNTPLPAPPPPPPPQLVETLTYILEVFKLLLTI